MQNLSTTIPIIRYQNASAAIQWLGDVFGFKIHLEVKGEGDRIEHARLVLGSSMIMVASLGREGVFEQKFHTPQSVNGVTQSLLLYIADPDALYTQAQANNAIIIDPISDSPFGGRMFSCEDLEGHSWVFTNHDPWQRF